MLDGKEITENARDFLQKWQASKEERKRKKEMTHDTLDGDVGKESVGCIMTQHKLCYFFHCKVYKWMWNWCIGCCMKMVDNWYFFSIKIL